MKTGATNLNSMTTAIQFFKQDNRWYADVPNRTLEENEMVEGADTLLDFLSDNHNRLSLLVSTTDVPEYLLHLTMTEHDKYGATYCMSNAPEDTIWLCNVTHDILDEHPEHLFILKIQLLD